MLLLPHCRHTKRGITFVVPRSRQLVPSLARSFVRSSWASVPLGCRVRVRVGQPKSELVVLGPVHRFVRSCCCSCASVLILWPNASVAFRCQFQCSGNFQARRSGSLANNEVNYTKWIQNSQVKSSKVQVKSKSSQTSDIQTEKPLISLRINWFSFELEKVLRNVRSFWKNPSKIYTIFFKCFLSNRFLNISKYLRIFSCVLENVWTFLIRTV